MSNSAAPLYNLSKIIEMSRGNNDFVKKMIELTIKESTSSKEKITEAYANSDFETLKYYAHRLKPSIFSLEIKEIKNDIVQIEALALNGQKTPELQAMVEKIDSVLNLVVKQLKSDYNF